MPYFHLVFTLPHDLNGLIGQCPRALYQMLFSSVAATLTEFAANPRWLGGTAAFTLVLHTWKQDLGRHVHLHALVPGRALGSDGKWVAAKHGFLFPITALSAVFQGKFVAALKVARQSGKLRVEAPMEDPTWEALLARLYVHDWVVYAASAAICMSSTFSLARRASTMRYSSRRAPSSNGRANAGLSFFGTTARARRST